MAIKKRDHIFLELGSGAKKGNGEWVTLDRIGACDIWHDLSKGIPFGDNSIERIYSSHLFEHFNSEAGLKLLKECMRVLKDGGEFSIAVPDASLYIRAYVNNTHIGWSMYNFDQMNVDSPMEYVKYAAYCHGQHFNMFDIDSLCAFMKKGGFSDVSPRLFDPQIDMEERKCESIYARGIAKK